MMGLDTIKINEHGVVTLHKLHFEKRDDVWYLFWETGTMQLLPEAIKEMVDSLNTFHLIEMHKQYHADVYDGTQWVFWVKQEPHEKSIYCNNYFPKDLVSFSEFLDDLLDKQGLADVTWTRVPENEFRKHEEELWGSLK